MRMIGNKNIVSVYAGIGPLLHFLFPCSRYIWGTRKRESIPERITPPASPLAINLSGFSEQSERLPLDASFAFYGLPDFRLGLCAIDASEIFQNPVCYG